MRINKLAKKVLLLLALTFAIELIQGIRAEELVSQKSSQIYTEKSLKGSNVAWRMRNSRRLVIGSTTSTCTYNECRGCKYKCRAEQVPVEGNDPVNSPYHYRCVCHGG
ncbi:epidermal patterning factor-like protein 9-like [Trifolium pratense]|uniref:Epidermal patterning factor-like protein 9-like n=1 Tax=Trifolium pratense TaxID=57577 RepID=A0A2K3MNJ8_TRIPR|nr:epidermal patterning factor-like protein 9-like [Trifolium pratense]PNY17805.1 epidermal patterning factor-like protein 9-like [Trifolium pratense]